jgi:hypothetical protein
MSNYLVYLHKDRCTNDVFYVGIGDRSRAYDEKNRSKEWKNRISECYFDVEIIAKSLPRTLAYEIEKSLIDLYGLNKLVNKTKGGSGALGYSHTDESKLKIAKGQLGKKRSQEEIDKSVNARISLYSNSYKHIETGMIFRGLKNGCIHFGINYKGEHQRIKRNSHNRNFELI